MSVKIIPAPTSNVDSTIDILYVQQMFREHIHVRSNLPKVIAQVYRAGYKAEAIEAVLDWGEGRRPLIDIWQELSTLLENSQAQVESSTGGVA